VIAVPILGSYNVHIDMDPDDTPLESAEKLRDGLKLAIAQVDEKKRREKAEAARKRQSFFGRIFG